MGEALRKYENNEENVELSPETCEYQGVTYFVTTEMGTGKRFITIDDGKRLYLDKNGRVANKQKGAKTCKTAIESFEDMKKVQDYFINNCQWNFYLLFTLDVNTARRISDLLAARWSDFFEKNGTMRTYWDVRKVNGERGEQKTGKIAEIYLNVAIKEAFKVYLRHEKVDIQDNYNEFIFKQLHGTHKGHVLTQEGYRQALIKASDSIGYGIRSHSMRRGFGKMSMELHPNDSKAKSVLMEIYNHSSEQITNKYIGETDKLKKEYFADMGENYKKYVMDGEDMPFNIRKPVSVYDNSELRRYMMKAFAQILDHADEKDPVALIDLYNSLLDGLEAIAKE